MCICSARMRNPPSCVTGCRLHNRTPSCATGRLDVLLESLPILLLNRVDSPIRLSDFIHHICFCNVSMPFVTVTATGYPIFLAVTSSGPRATIASISSKGIPRCIVSGSLSIKGYSCSFLPAIHWDIVVASKW